MAAAPPRALALQIRPLARRARIHVFGVLDHGPPRWINSSSGAELKLAIKDILHLR